jgi:hypothetical protein
VFYSLFEVLMLLFKVALIFIGAGVAINSVRGLFSGEGMFDRENTRYMVWIQIAGIVGGIGAFAWGFWSLAGPLFR